MKENLNKTDGGLRAQLPWTVGGFTFTPAMLTLATWLAPHLSLAHVAQDLGTFLCAVTTVTASLFVLARGWLPTRGWIAVSLLASAPLVFFAFAGVNSATAVVAVGTCLIALGHSIGHAIGSRIEHPGHLLPACVVAGCVDLASVIHPMGPTHEVVKSERALDLLTLSFPVLGTHAHAPSIGVGDIVFGALVLGASVRHELSVGRVAWLLAGALILAGLSSALLERAVPALPIIGLLIVVGVRPARELLKKDRQVATFFMLAAAALAAGVVVSRFLA